jgi:hypothetical protein
MIDCSLRKIIWYGRYILFVAIWQNCNSFFSCWKTKPLS